MESLKTAKLPILADEFTCTACLACENICDQKAIIHSIGSDGHVHVKIREDLCVGCLKCQRICEKSRNCFGENDIASSNIYAAWTQKHDERMQATSGGVFAAFAETILNKGGCVIGAELSGFDCRLSVIYKNEDISKLQGSKYMASSMENVYSIIRAELVRRDVLFTGLGCQCAGVIAYFSGFRTSYTLYTADLVCGGIPSRLLIDHYMTTHPDVKGFKSFRTKDLYELKVSAEEGEKTVREKNLPLHGFNCGLTNRYNCYNCQFAKAHRKTDITIGDLWDYSVVPQEHKKGVSMVLVHSKNGQELLESSDIHAEKIQWEGALLHNKRTVYGKAHVFSPRKRLTRNSQKMNEEKFRKLYTMDIGPDTPLLFLFRVYRYMIQRIETKKAIKTIRSIISREN